MKILDWLKGTLKMSVTVHQDNIFWTTEPFVTKLDMLIHHHKPECQGTKHFLIALFKVKVTVIAQRINI